MCTSDISGSTISCLNNFPVDKLRDSILGTSGTGNLLFGTSPTILNPVITNIAPGADFKLTQNLVEPFTSVNTGAVANTLYLKGGNVGIGTTNPIYKLQVEGNSFMNGVLSLPAWTGMNSRPSLVIGSDLGYGITRINGTASIAVISNGGISAQFAI